MSECQSFAPVAAKDSRLLILGSMPGVRSLQLGQYYGHPHNRFWPLMAQLLGYQAVPAGYQQKLQMLLANRIALWDVLGYCQREGSLDAAITGEQPNDLAGFLRQHPQLTVICAMAAKLPAALKKYSKTIDLSGITVYNLPSTSPANARWRLPQLAAAWQIVQTTADQANKNP